MTKKNRDNIIRKNTINLVQIGIFQVSIRNAAKIDIITKGKNSKTRSAVADASPISNGVPSTSFRR